MIKYFRPRRGQCITGAQRRMVKTCCVAGCSSRAGKEKDIKFYSIPGVNERRGKELRELSIRRRTEWLSRINRKDWAPSKNARVCSVHFVTGMNYLCEK